MELRATTKLRNNVMIAKRESLGLNQTKFGALCGVSVRDIGDFEKLNFKVVNAEDKAVKIALVCKVNVEKIMPHELVNQALHTNLTQVKTVSTLMLKDFVGDFETRSITASPEDVAIDMEVKEAINDVLKTLTHRERKILEMRLALNGQRERTLEEIGKVFKITRERVRGIEANAIRKLQRPTRANKLASVLGVEL